MKLILTEKPSVSKVVKEVLAPQAKYIKCAGAGQEPLGYYEDKNYVICNTVGHCISILEPKEINANFTWDLSQLPYAFPKELPLKITEGKEALFEVIQTCFDKHEYDEVIIATDGDREGQNIWRKIYSMLRPFKAKISRVWLSEWTPEGIKGAFDARFPNDMKKSLEAAAQCREEADYIIGMNCTVALTKKYAQGKGNVASIGRVMGPTMHIVYSREQEIINFKSTPYTTLAIETASDGKDTLLLKMKRQDKLSFTEASKIEEKLKNSKQAVLNKEVRRITKRCPELYDATTIAQDMNKRYGFSAKKTADIIQRLYQDYALTTYPGTNARKISEGSARKVYQILKNLVMYDEYIKEIMDNKWGVSSHVVTNEGLAHEAITPVYGSINKAVINKLSEDEMRVYKAIIERFLATFYPKAELEEAVVSTEVGGECFEARGKIVLSAGWMKVLGAMKDVSIPNIHSGHAYAIKNIIKENKNTVPPLRYTEETLLAAMKNAGRFVKDRKEAAILNSKEVEGLGTGRTRPAIIENIKNKKYFEIRKKYIYPTSKCMDLFDVLPDTTLSSPSLTAQFEQMIQDVEDGKMTKEEYLNKINKDVNAIVEKIKSDVSGKMIGGDNAVHKISEIGKCPICGGNIIENKKAFGCSNWKNGCNFTIWKNQRGKELTKSQVKSLLSKGKTTLIKGMTNRSSVSNSMGNGSNTYDGYLTFDKNEDGTSNYTRLILVKNVGKCIGNCSCGGEIHEEKDKYCCTRCGTKIYKNALSRYGKDNLTKKEVKTLIEGKMIDVNLVSKAGKPYKKKAYFDEKNKWITIVWK